MSKIELKDVLCFDVETTGLPQKGHTWDKDFRYFPYIASISWVLNGVEKDYIIKPDGYEIPQEVADIHGITTEKALSEGVPFTDIIDEFLNDAARAKMICAHNIYFDVSIVKANVMRYMGQSYYDEMCDRPTHKSRRIDTMRPSTKLCGKWPKLTELYAKLFPGETFDAHNSLSDVQALYRCLPVLVEMGIVNLEITEYETNAEGKEVPIKKTGNATGVKNDMGHRSNDKSVHGSTEKSNVKKQAIIKRVNKISNDKKIDFSDIGNVPLPVSSPDLET